MTDYFRIASVIMAVMVAPVLAAALICPAASQPSQEISSTDARYLISPEESRGPSQELSILDARGIPRGPTIRLIAPTAKDRNLEVIEASDIRSPFTFQLQIKANSGSSVDWSTFKATYLNSPGVPLTARLLPFKNKTNDGIIFQSAEIPPGVHQFRIDVSDTDRLPSSKIIILTVKQR